MKTLIFYPRPFPGESIGSILIRASAPHRLPPLQLMRGINRPYKSIKLLIQSILLGNTEDLKKIARVDNWKAPLMQKSDETNHFEKWFAYTNAALCPHCVENGWLPHTHDYVFSTTCIIHACKLVRSCPTCSQPLRWNRPKLNQATCNHAILNATPASAFELEEAIILDQWIDFGKIDLIESYLAVRDTLANRYQIFDTSPKLIQALIEGDANHFAPTLQTILANLENIPQRAALSPLATSCGPLVKSRLKLIDRNTSFTSTTRNDRETDFYLNRFELAESLGLNLITTDRLIRDCFPLHQLGKRETKKIPISSLGPFYQALIPTLSNPNDGATLRQVSSSKKHAIGTLIRKIMNGEIKPTYFDEDADIGDLKIDDSPPSVHGIPEGYLSLGQTVARLNTHAAVVIECYKRSLLPGIKLRNKNQYAFCIENIEYFLQDYVIGANLRSSKGKPMKRISEKLIAAGIQPVSGKFIDDSSVYIFRKKDLIGVNIDAINDNPNYAKHLNRGPKNHHGLDRSKWVKSAAAAKRLGISIQQLHIFVNRKLLIQKIPELSNSAKLRYFRIDSVETANIFIKSLVPMRELCAEINLSLRAAKQRMAYLIKSRPLLVNKVEYIEQSHARILRDHSSAYWDLTKVASSLHVQKKVIFEWILEGAINTLTPSDLGYIPEMILVNKEMVHFLAHEKTLN